jgi:hypothetical protein
VRAARSGRAIAPTCRAVRIREADGIDPARRAAHSRVIVITYAGEIGDVSHPAGAPSRARLV